MLLGPQGSGKGTQAQQLAALTGARHISTGDIVRAEIRAGTPLGRTIEGYSTRGELVPDALMVNLALASLRTLTSWILDGFPRDAAQARALDDALADEGMGLDRVIVLSAPDDVLVGRLAGRRQSQATGRVYHVVSNPPPADDPGPFLCRADDTPAAIRRRLAIYHAATEPLKEYYGRRGLLTEIDASGPIDTVTAAILVALGDDAAQPTDGSGQLT